MLKTAHCFFYYVIINRLEVEGLSLAERSIMGEITWQCVSKPQENPEEMFNVILCLGKSILDDMNFETNIIEPLSVRAYHA